MSEWVFQGTVSLSGATFYITAETEEEARAKARAGSFDSYELCGASAVDWDIDQHSGEKNE